MLYLFHGTNQKKIQEQSSAVIESLRTKREFAQVFYIHADTFDIYNLEGQQNTQGLFFDKHIFVYKNLLSSTKETREYILENIKEYIASPHLHLLIEGDLDEKYLKELQKHAEVVVKTYVGGVIHPQKEDISKKMFNTVGVIADLKSSTARSVTKKMHAWKYLDELRSTGTAPEEFFGILWWKYKTLVQARDADQKGSGLTPYTYTQAKKTVAVYSHIQKDMSTLLSIYHDAHNGESDMWEDLEGWLLQ